MVGTRAKSLLKLTPLLVVVALAICFVVFTDSGRSLDRGRIRAFIESVDPFLARLLYVVAYIAGAILLLPGLVFSFIGAMLFGIWEGTLYTWIGATIGATCAFLFARALGREFVDRLLGGKLQALDQRLRQHGFVSLLILRLVPLFPFNGLNFGCGLTSLRLRDYVLATAIGIVPGTFVYQYLFATFGEKVLTEGFVWRDLATMEVLLPMGLFVLFTVAAGWVARRLGRVARPESSKGVGRSTPFEDSERATHR